MGARNPKRDPIPGDVISHRFGDHRVREVCDGIVYYWDEGLIDHVPIATWRRWYLGRRDCKVTKRGDE